LVGFPASYALGFHTPLGAAGIWVGLSIGTATHATLLILRFLKLSNTAMTA
jgi:MATE family multidrug resistance protein